MTVVHLTSFRIEGGLFPSDFAERLTSKSSGLEGLSPTDYGKQDQAERDEAIQIAFRQTLSAWRRLQAALHQAPKTDTHTSLTRERFLLPLFEALGYGRLPVAKAQKVGERTYAISHQWMHVPIHLLGIAIDLDRRDKGIRGASQASPHGLVQECLNASDAVLWAILSNGHTLRLLRDHKSLTRNAYVEFDLERICEDEDYPGFALLWLLCHSSRAAAEKPESLWWEKWYEQSRQDGVRALDRLRDGVKVAIETLGSGFLEHPANVPLCEALQSGELSTDGYYRLLLRVVYRLLFLFVAEDRGVLLASREEFEDARRRFLKDYGTGRLRSLAQSIRGTQHGDRWQVLRLVMNKLGDGGCPALALPDLGPGFWGKEQLGLLAGAELRNVSLFDAVRALAFTEENGVLHPVRYRDLGATEFGSVYESLLELKPQQVRPEVFSLAQAAGNERKTTGAYYTPDSLVQCLLDSALEPLLLRCRESKDPAAELLDLKVCDPACGSGHFLVAAAHRIAKALAQVRSGDDEPSPRDRREAMRDVVARCLYGVDVSEMAVELCKVNLWLEAQAPDLPLAFLDAHIQQGNALLGATPELISKGIPDVALDPLLGDDKEFCKQLKKENKKRRQAGATMFDVEGRRGFAWGGKTLAKDYLAVEAVADRSAASVREKAEAFGRWAAGEARRREELVADAWCAAFVMKKTKGAPPPVTEELFAKVRDGVGELPSATERAVKLLGREFRFCHWWLKFPGVFGDGLRKRGFDLVIGNPPWEASDLLKGEFFSALIQDSGGAKTSDTMDALIAKATAADPVLARAWEDARRRSEAEAHLTQQSGRYPMTSIGKLNTYRTFAELSQSLICADGRLAMILKSGIVNAQDNQLFFASIIKRRGLIAIRDFINTKQVFPAVVANERFCCFVVSGANGVVDAPTFMFCLDDVKDLTRAERLVRIAEGDLEVVNPNDLSVPPVSSAVDYGILTRIHRRFPVLAREGDGHNPMHVRYSRGDLNSSTDSALFSKNDLESLAERGLAESTGVWGDAVRPLLEGKLIGSYNHRFGTFLGVPRNRRFGKKSEALAPTELQLGDPSWRAVPRYWLASDDAARLTGRHGPSRGWCVAYRHVCRAIVDARTAQVAIVPRYPASDSCAILTLGGGAREAARNACLIIASWTSFVGDYVIRQKLYGPALTKAIAQQLPVPTERHIGELAPSGVGSDFFMDRVLELSYVSWDMKPFADDMGYDGPPFRWNFARRFRLRCELDAAFFHLYGLTRDEVAYVMDTFPIVRRHDEAEHGDYRTKLTILKLYDQMTTAIVTGKAFQSELEVSAANPSPYGMGDTRG